MSAQSVPLQAGFSGLGQSFGRAFGQVPRWVLAALAGIVIVGLIAGTIAVRSKSAVQVVTAPIVQQTLTQSVTASGTVNPQNSISVGTQVSGTISQLDVDYNSKVTKGEVLARIDPSTIQAQLDQAQANLAQAQAQAAQAGANASGAGAGVVVAQANANAQVAAANAAKTAIPKAQSALTLAQQQLARDQALFNQGYTAQETVQTDQSNVAQDQAALAQAQAAYAQALAQTQASDATIGQNGSTAQAQEASAQAAQAAVQAAQATVQQDQVNLNNTVITSPVNGTVIARDVSIGQTVAASLQTPTLFTIAQNLNQMEVDINVGEPDIGGVKAGDNVDFSVLAYPNQVFHGNVTQVRINPQTVNNVVTYDVVVDVDNTSGQLLPGMTANATIDVASAQNALVVPLSAVHATGALRQAQGDTSGASAANPWGGAASTNSSVTQGENGSVTVQTGNKLQRVPVQVGLVTATQAAVTPANGSTLSAGEKVVTAFTGALRRAQGDKGGTQTASSNPLSGGSATRGATRGLP
jgi:HlyD family secretion protein